MALPHPKAVGPPDSTKQDHEPLRLLKAALDYQQQKLCVVPLRGKRPAIASWKQYQKKPSTDNEIRGWYVRGLLQNIGLVCGPVSDNLVVLDFDGAAGYPAFAATFPRLAETRTVATGGGVGQHVYLRALDLPPTTRALNTPLGHIELRSAGTYVVAPPSRHPTTNKLYRVEKKMDILKVHDLRDVVAWVEGFNPVEVAEWTPPKVSVKSDASINPAVVEAISSELLKRGFKPKREWLHGCCIYPHRHKNGDRNASFGFNTETAYGYCYVCGSMLAKDVCQALDIDVQQLGGLMKKPPVPVMAASKKPTQASTDKTPSMEPPAPPNDKLPALDEIELPNWLKAYVDWASKVGNQTPVTFHLGMGLWMAAVAIARRVYASAPWGVRLYPNLYMMFIADTTFYRKTTAYKLGERVLTASIPHMLMPTPGSPERFQDAMSGRAPSNFSSLPQDLQKVVLEAQKFAAQRGLFKDEIAGLFGSFKRDYMAGLKDFLLEVYDCPDFTSKETQSGLAIVRQAALSILGVTTPAGLSTSISSTDWDNGLLPRFALLTPEPDYAERPTLTEALEPPKLVIDGLKQLHNKLPQPQRNGDSWQAAKALQADVAVWPQVQTYSNQLRQQCDPRLETPLDDRLKGIYGRLHVQALKVALICASLDWLEGDQQHTPKLTEKHWQTGRAIAEHWRLSAGHMLTELERSGSARAESRLQDKVMQAVNDAGSSGVKLHTVYKNHNLRAADARQVAKDLVQAGKLVEIRIGRAEAYIAAKYLEQHNTKQGAKS